MGRNLPILQAHTEVQDLLAGLRSQMHLLTMLHSHLNFDPNLCWILIFRNSTLVFTLGLSTKSDRQTHTHTNTYTYKTRVKSDSWECGHLKLSGLDRSYQQPALCVIWCDYSYYSFLHEIISVIILSCLIILY